MLKAFFYEIARISIMRGDGQSLILTNASGSQNWQGLTEYKAQCNRAKHHGDKHQIQ